MKLFWAYVIILGSAVAGFTFLPTSNTWICSGAHTVIGWLAVAGTITAMVRYRPGRVDGMVPFCSRGVLQRNRDF